MERLTTRNERGDVLLPIDPEETDTVELAFEKLAAYEDAMPLERAQELAQAEKDGRLVALPCKVGDVVLVDVRTIPYNYLNPLDGCGDYAKCEIVSIVTTKKETYMKLRAMYPSRARRREYLRYGVTAIGKTIFLAR